MIFAIWRPTTTVKFSPAPKPLSFIILASGLKTDKWGEAEEDGLSIEKLEGSTYQMKGVSTLIRFNVHILNASLRRKKGIKGYNLPAC